MYVLLLQLHLLPWVSWELLLLFLTLTNVSVTPTATLAALSIMGALTVVTYSHKCICYSCSYTGCPGYPGSSCCCCLLGQCDCYSCSYTDCSTCRYLLLLLVYLLLLQLYLLPWVSRSYCCYILSPMYLLLLQLHWLPWVSWELWLWLSFSSVLHQVRQIPRCKEWENNIQKRDRKDEKRVITLTSSFFTKKIY